MVSNPNKESEKEVLAEHGLTVDQIINEFKLFQSSWEVSKDAPK